MKLFHYFLRIIPRSGIAGSKGMHILNFDRYCQIALHKGCTSLHSYQQCMSAQYCTSSPMLDTYNLCWKIGRFLFYRQILSHCFNVFFGFGLICGEVKHLFTLAIFISSFVDCLFAFFTVFYWVICLSYWLVGVFRIQY